VQPENSSSLLIALPSEVSLPCVLLKICRFIILLYKCVLPAVDLQYLGCVRFQNQEERNGMVPFRGHGMVPTLCPRSWNGSVPRSREKNEERNGSIPVFGFEMGWNGMRMKLF
jgi:hypothetical protein